MDCDIVERAYELAASGEYQSVNEIVIRLKTEGHVAVLTALRSRTFRRELRSMCSRTQTDLQDSTSQPPRHHQVGTTGC